MEDACDANPEEDAEDGPHDVCETSRVVCEHAAPTHGEGARGPAAQVVAAGEVGLERRARRLVAEHVVEGKVTQVVVGVAPEHKRLCVCVCMCECGKKERDRERDGLRNKPGLRSRGRPPGRRGR